MYRAVRGGVCDWNKPKGKGKGKGKDESKPAEKAPLLAQSGLTAEASRKVDDSGLKGTRLVRKEDREEDYLPAVKKGKKGKKDEKCEKEDEQEEE